MTVVRPPDRITLLRDHVGGLLRSARLHRLSGWWDAGTDAREIRVWGYVSAFPDENSARDNNES